MVVHLFHLPRAYNTNYDDCTINHVSDDLHLSANFQLLFQLLYKHTTTHILTVSHS